MNILLTLAFNGGQYHGFQVQENAISVCAVLQDSMQKVFGYRPDVKGCSRTDAGVHALNYCVNFHCETNISDSKMPLALNYHLPRDIRVKAARRVPQDFHARYAASGKQYKYVWLNSAVDDPFRTGQYYRLYVPMDVEKMNMAAKCLVGRHDFASFMSAGSSVEDTVRTVTQLEVECSGDWVTMKISADGFLYNMVRIIAGTLLLVGMGRWPREKVKQTLEAKNRQCAGETQHAKGLFLSKVYYPTDSFEFPCAD